MMDVRSFEAREPAGTVDAVAVAELLSGIGTARFTEAALAFCARSLGASFVSIFVPGGEARPILIGTATTTHPLNARRAADGYMRHYAEDANFRLLTAPGPQGMYLTYQKGADLPSIGYRRDCYERTGIADRLSLVRSGGHDRLALSLYRSRASGPFAEGARAQAARLFPLLLQAVDRHLATAPAAASASVPDLEELLRRRQPDLTLRECQVAARVIAGRSAAAIAAELGLSENTIVTHRKRAYSRLGVSGMKALLRG